LIDFDNFEATGSILTMSVGANAVLPIFSGHIDRKLEREKPR
jgi:hypothetical protein